MPDEPINNFNFQNYFSISYNDLNYTSWNVFVQFIIPNLYVQDRTSYTIYERYTSIYEDTENHDVKHSFGNTILIFTLSNDDLNWTINTKIDDKTGIIRENTINLIHYEDDEVVNAIISETVYTGGISLANAEISSTILVIIGVPFSFVILKRKEN
ncbi:MAG: hypothetical protein ACTSQ4_07730 [Candidatus Heimdallarchaeaceae archaeon]